MDIVLDTNVIVSGVINPDGAIESILKELKIYGFITLKNLLKNLTGKIVDNI